MSPNALARGVSAAGLVVCALAVGSALAAGGSVAVIWPIAVLAYASVFPALRTGARFWVRRLAVGANSALCLFAVLYLAGLATVGDRLGLAPGAAQTRAGLAVLAIAGVALNLRALVRIMFRDHAAGADGGAARR